MSDARQAGVRARGGASLYWVRALTLSSLNVPVENLHHFNMPVQN